MGEYKENHSRAGKRVLQLRWGRRRVGARVYMWTNRPTIRRTKDIKPIYLLINNYTAGISCQVYVEPIKEYNSKQVQIPI